MTCGKGIQHSEMFPLVYEDKENRMELFQIWLNLPAKHKMVDPEYAMFWSDDIPQYKSLDNLVSLKVISGSFDKVQSLAAPKYSVASDPQYNVQIFVISMKKNGKLKIARGECNSNKNSLSFLWR